jgi:hypothetical protein
MRRIHERSDELRSLCAQYLDGGEPVSQTPPVDGDGPVDVRSDESLIAKAKAALNGEKFAALWEGRWQALGYESPSEAEYGLMSELRFWTGNDRDRMVTLLRASGLKRPKLDRDDYVYGMADKLISAGGDVYGATKATVAGTSGLPVPRASDWPAPLEPEAFHGPLGQAVQIMAPHSEADPAALLLNMLVTFGAQVGPKPHMLVGRDKHPPRLFGTIVGETAKGRKGHSWGMVNHLFNRIDPTLRGRVTDGLASGEGLLHAVRDRVVKVNVDGVEEVVDEGVPDKRLLVIEPEYVRVLEMGKRPGNILSAVMRSAWDTGDLNTLVKTSPARATAAHICVVGHITQYELVRKLNDTDIANGFANRVLHVCAQRANLLPFGGELPESDLDEVVEASATAVVFSQSIGQMAWAPETRPLWVQAYARLSQGGRGLFGALTARAEAQVLRLTIVYALADFSPELRPEHLRAALAVWRYVEDSTRYVFGTRTGDAIADKILEEARGKPEGLTRTQIRDLFGRHRTEAEIASALGLLRDLGLAHMERRQTGGKPQEVWHATEAT